MEKRFVAPAVMSMTHVLTVDSVNVKTDDRVTLDLWLSPTGLVTLSMTPSAAESLRDALNEAMPRPNDMRK